MTHSWSHCRPTLFAALVAAGLFALLFIVKAQELPDADHYKGWRVSSFEVRGAPKELTEPLKEGLSLYGESRLVFRDYPIFFSALLNDDVDRARLFLARHGYPFARVTPRLQPNERQRRVAVVLDVDSGPAVRIKELDVTGMPSVLERRAHEILRVKPGHIFSEPAVDTSGARLLRLLHGAGHARAEVESRVVRLDSTRVTLTFDVTPGARYWIDGIEVHGASSDLVPLARRTADIEPGTPYSPALISRARMNLRVLDLFRRVDLSTRETASDSLAVDIDLSESPHRAIEIGAGYWSEEQLRAHASWEHRNLLKAGRGARLSVSYSRFLQDAGILMWWPTVFGARTRADLDVAVQRQNEENYELFSTNVRLGVTYQPWLNTTLRGGVTLSDTRLEIKVEDPESDPPGDALLTIFSASWLRDASNDRLYPTQGSVTWLSAQWSPPGIFSETHFIRSESSGVVYFHLGRGFVTAGRLALGLVQPIGDSPDLSPNWRFYSGGAQTMRGFKRRQLGPLDENRVPLGGEALLEASTELRFSIFWRLHGAIFVDAGQVWSRVEDVRLRDFEVAIGPGLRVQTPVGPGRIDWGYRLTEQVPDQPRAVLHISVGNPY